MEEENRNHYLKCVFCYSFSNYRSNVRLLLKYLCNSARGHWVSRHPAMPRLTAIYGPPTGLNRQSLTVNVLAILCQIRVVFEWSGSISCVVFGSTWTYRKHHVGSRIYSGARWDLKAPHRRAKWNEVGLGRQVLQPEYGRVRDSFLDNRRYQGLECSPTLSVPCKSKDQLFEER